MKTTTLKNLKNIIIKFYETKKPLFLWGTFGIGKSQSVREAAMEIATRGGMKMSENWDDINDPEKFMLIDIRLAMSDPSDLKGLPDFKDDGVIWKMNKWFPRDGYGIIFLDEFNLADEATAKACYQLVNDRELNGYKLPDGYAVIMAGNENSDGVNTTDLPVPLLNRMAHVKVELNTDDWLQWATEVGIHDDIRGFIAAYPDQLHIYKDGMDGRDSVSPRNWSHISDMLRDAKTIEEKCDIIEMWANSTAAQKFKVWHNFISKLDIKGILNGTKKAPSDDVEQLMLMSFLGLKIDDMATFEKALKIDGIMEEYKLLLTKMVLINMRQKKGLSEALKYFERYKKVTKNNKNENNTTLITLQDIMN